MHDNLEFKYKPGDKVYFVRNFRNMLAGMTAEICGVDKHDRILPYQVRVSGVDRIHRVWVPAEYITLDDTITINPDIDLSEIL